MTSLSEWDRFDLWRRQIERRLNELGSQVKGNTQWEADRISDLVEQIAEVRKQVEAVSHRQEALIERLKQKFGNGEEEGVVE